MEKEVLNKGVIYILTNPSFPEYVKIGYADDVEKRLQTLNKSECIPFAFRLYAYYEVSARLTDKKVHEIIDNLNPGLRSIDDVDGKKRVREFYAMDAEEAYLLLKSISEVNGLQKNLHKVEPTKEEIIEEEEANSVRIKEFDFSKYNIKVGSKIKFIHDNTLVCRVVNNNKVEYNGVDYSLSSLAKLLLNVPYDIGGPRYFEYNGVPLNILRKENYKL